MSSLIMIFMQYMVTYIDERITLSIEQITESTYLALKVKHSLSCHFATDDDMAIQFESFGKIVFLLYWYM